MTQSSISPKSLRRYAAVILCGGKSSRMGFDKTLLTLRDGRRLLAATAEKLSERFGEVVLAVGSEERLGQFSDFSGYTLVADDQPHSGPAGAVASALSEVAPRAAFVMAGDMVKVDFGLIERLADLIEAGAEAAVPVHGGRKEPLYAFYASSAGPFLAEAAREGRGTLREAFPKLRTLFLELFDSELAPGLFENINTPEEAMAASLNPPANLSPKAEEASPLFGLDAQALQTTKKEGVEDQASKQKGPAFQVSQASRMRDPASPVLEQDSQAPPALELERPDALGLELDFKGSEGTRSLSAAFRSIPKVDKVLALARQSGGPLSGLSPEALVLAVREALARRREAIAQGRESEPWEPLAAVAQEAEKQAKPGLSPVINATGVVLHTNLGRAPLSKEAAQSVAKIASGYSSLEYDPHLGRRASRQRHVEKLLLEIFGGEAALAVNNNAAALLLVAAALAPGREVIISRGELVEIGASFRLGDILEAGGAILREVGSTNRTAAADYERAAQSGSPALIMSVHAGNFRLVGYGGRPEMKELSEVARRYSLPLVCDLGSGSLFDLSAILPEEPRPSQVLSLGASLVTMSGDKLMGAGQAGLIVGRGDLVEAMRRHPIARAVRIDKLSLAALEATLRLALRPKEAMESIPAMAMLSASQDSLQRKAEALLAAIGPVFGLNLEISEVSGQAGGGSAPATDLPSFAVAASPPEGSLVRLEEALRRGPVPVIGRIFANRLLLDVRTMDEDDFPVVAEAIREAAKASI